MSIAGVEAGIEVLTRDIDVWETIVSGKTKYHLLDVASTVKGNQITKC